MQNKTFYYFDGIEERKIVIQQVRDVRRDVIRLAKQVPEKDHFLPRYEGRSLAVTLVHLQMADSAALWFVKTSADLRNELKLHPPLGLVRWADDMVCNFFKRRQVATTITDIKKQQAAICEYIRNVPLELLHKDVCHPGRREPYTIEQAIQIYFVHNWQHHLALMQQVEGVRGEKP
jgi:hypothetical protein